MKIDRTKKQSVICVTEEEMTRMRDISDKLGRLAFDMMKTDKVGYTIDGDFIDETYIHGLSKAIDAIIKNSEIDTEYNSKYMLWSYIQCKCADFMNSVTGVSVDVAGEGTMVRVSTVWELLNIMETAISNYIKEDME